MGAIIGIALAVGPLFGLILKKRKQPDFSLGPLQPDTSLAGAIIAACLIAFGIPGLDLLPQAMQDFFTGFSVGWLPTLSIGTALFVYRYE